MNRHDCSEMNLLCQPRCILDSIIISAQSHFLYIVVGAGFFKPVSDVAALIAGTAHVSAAAPAAGVSTPSLNGVGGTAANPDRCVHELLNLCDLLSIIECMRLIGFIARI